MSEVADAMRSFQAQNEFHQALVPLATLQVWAEDYERLENSLRDEQTRIKYLAGAMDTPPPVPWDTERLAIAITALKALRESRSMNAWAHMVVYDALKKMGESA